MDAMEVLTHIDNMSDACLMRYSNYEHADENNSSVKACIKDCNKACINELRQRTHLLEHYVCMEVKKFARIVEDWTKHDTVLRKDIVRWIIQFSHESNMDQNTLFSAVVLYDRYVCAAASSQENHQKPLDAAESAWQACTTACAVMLTSSKIEEVYPCSIFSIMESACENELFLKCWKGRVPSAADILTQERVVMQALANSVYSPTCNTYLEFYARQVGAWERDGGKLYAMASLIAEVILQEGSMLQFWPSRQARAALFVAGAVRTLQQQHRRLDIDNLERTCGYTEHGSCLSIGTSFFGPMLPVPFHGCPYGCTQDADAQDAQCVKMTIDLTCKWIKHTISGKKRKLAVNKIETSIM